MSGVLAIALVRKQELAIELERLDEFVRLAETLQRAQRLSLRCGRWPARVGPDWPAGGVASETRRLPEPPRQAAGADRQVVG